MFKPVRQQEAVRCNAQGGVMMKAAPAPSLVVAQTKFLFEILIVPFNAPAHLGSLTKSTSVVSAGNVDSQYLVGSA